MKSKKLVLGLGISGKAASAFLLSRGVSVIAADAKQASLRTQADVQQLLSQGLLLTDENLSLNDIDQIILSPGIPLSHPLVAKAQEMGIEVVGEIEMAFRFLNNRCIGITGSNGKTTTTLMIAHVLNACGIKAIALGNVGIGLSSYLLHIDPKEVLVIELSSFQLETLKTKKLGFALVLNITENHLDRYPSMKEYAEAKLSIQNCLKEGGAFFSSQTVIDAYRLKNANSFESAQMSEMGQNIQAAYAICREFGITEEAFFKALKSFQKPPHRMEWVAEMDGAIYYNDSKSSNIESTIFGLGQVQGPVILIVGGKDKGSPYTPWIEAFRGKVKHVVAYGAAKDKIVDEIGPFFPCTKIGPFEKAVHFACEMAVKNDTVLLSPGCSSYDQFANFERRGEAFRELIRQRKNGS